MVIIMVCCDIGGFVGLHINVYILAYTLAYVSDFAQLIRNTE